jgi:tetratricopeptide (TPR) repeat protein
LRNRATQRENFDISAVYYQFVTQQADQTMEVCELWAQTYPNDFTPHRILGFENANLGRWERSAAEFRKAMEVDPTQALPYAGVMGGNLALNRFADAHAAYQAAIAHNLQAGEPTRWRYLLAFLEGDKATMTQTADELTREPGFEDRVIIEQSSTKLYFGQVRVARELSQVLFDTPTRKKDKLVLVAFEAGQAFVAVLFGRLKDARELASASLQLGGDPAMALALLGDTDQASAIAKKWASHAPEGGLEVGIFVPEVEAVVELKHGNFSRALELLEPVKRYEAGWGDRYMAAYLRGQVYLAARRGPEAALEFQKILDHRGVVLNSVIGALSHVGLARAHALQGDAQSARTSYENFFDLWRDADKDMPILIAAKSEYAKLQ